MTRQNTRDAILVVTVFGAILLMPPFLPFFDRPIDLFGMPLIVVYVFGVWLTLICLACFLSRRLPTDAPREPLGNAEADDGDPNERPG